MKLIYKNSIIFLSTFFAFGLIHSASESIKNPEQIVNEFATALRQDLIQANLVFEKMIELRQQAETDTSSSWKKTQLYTARGFGYQGELVNPVVLCQEVLLELEKDCSNQTWGEWFKSLTPKDFFYACGRGLKKPFTGFAYAVKRPFPFTRMNLEKEEVDNVDFCKEENSNTSKSTVANFFNRPDDHATWTNVLKSKLENVQSKLRNLYRYSYTYEVVQSFLGRDGAATEDAIKAELLKKDALGFAGFKNSENLGFCSRLASNLAQMINDKKTDFDKVLRDFECIINKENIFECIINKENIIDTIAAEALMKTLTSGWRIQTGVFVSLITAGIGAVVAAFKIFGKKKTDLEEDESNQDSKEISLREVLMRNREKLKHKESVISSNEESPEEKK